MNFSFYTAGEIIFGQGKLALLGELAARFGRKTMIVTRGTSIKQNGFLTRVELFLHEKEIQPCYFNIPSGEPTVSEVDKGAEFARREKPDSIIGIGGGSTIDLAKAISGLATNLGSVKDYLEGVGRGWQIEKESVPHIAVPTTAGTGSEVTKNAVISSDGREYKKSIRSPHLIPNIALLDPELTVSVPRNVTAETGMDALTQLIESYVSAKRQPIPQALSIYGIKLAGENLVKAVKTPANLEAREAMMLSSLLSGISLANSGLGAAHGIAAALGALAHIPHGKACAMLIPKIMRINLPHCVAEFAEIADALKLGDGLPQEQKAEKAVKAVEQLSKDIGVVTNFSRDELDPDLLPALVAGSQGSSMTGNPVKLMDSQIETIIEDLME
jgi:alcohol dehydrogenase class IV